MGRPWRPEAGDCTVQAGGMEGDWRAGGTGGTLEAQLASVAEAPHGGKEQGAEEAAGAGAGAAGAGAGAGGVRAGVASSQGDSQDD